jgi:3-hydroxyisobutyrate dehydrogenase-like beta-hydroxyacid dehydrogenase
MVQPAPFSDTDRPRLALFGTGMMGLPIARRLCQAGLDLCVWNRTPDKALPLQAHGARIATSAAGAAAQANLVITLLTDGEAVANLLFDQGVAEALQPGSLVVDMSSIKPAQARDHARRLAALPQGAVWHLDAPVSGGTVGAEQGTLAIMAGGDAAAFERALPLFAPLGRATHVGPVGAGQLAKLANQMIVGITIGAVAEALLLCEKGGADMAQVRTAISGGFAESRILQVHGQRMVDRDFTKRAAMTVQLKDMRNALDTARELGFDAPIATLFEALYGQAVAHGLNDLDHSGLFVELARRNGLA